MFRSLEKIRSGFASPAWSSPAWAQPASHSNMAGASPLHKLNTTNHGNQLKLAPAPAHPVLGYSRENLSRLRVCPEQACNMNLIRKGNLSPVLERVTDFAPPKILYKNKPTLAMALSEQERVEIFNDLSRTQNPPGTHTVNTLLHLAEVRAVQDYMSHSSRAKHINHFLRGGKPGDLDLFTPGEMIEFSLLFISALNALPAAEHNVHVHTLPFNSPMFKAIAQAEEDKKNLYLDYFLSTTPLKTLPDGCNQTGPNKSFGCTTVLVKSCLTADIHFFNNIFEHEKESVVPPYEAFRVKALSRSKPEDPVFMLEGLTERFS